MEKTVFDEIRKSIIAGKSKDASNYSKLAMDAGITQAETLSQAIIPSINQVIDLYSNSKIYIPDVLIAIRAIENSLKALDVKPNDDRMAMSTPNEN